MGKRKPYCDKETVKKGTWSAEEDAILRAYAEKLPTVSNWVALPKKIGLNRCGKSCRLRWLNYLRPNIKRDKFSEEEDKIIFDLYSTIGSRWSIMAEKLPGRTDNDIKNYWNTKMNKKYGIKHYHRPLYHISFHGCNDATPTTTTTTTTPTTQLGSDDVSTIHPGGGGRGGDDNNIFTITHGDIMSTTWPSTSQLLLQPPPQPLNVVEQSLGGAAGAVHVSPSKGGVTFKDLEDLLFDNNNNNNNNALVTEGHDHLIRVDEAGVRNNVVVDTSGADFLVICGESVPSWDVGELIPDTPPSLAVNTTDNDLHNLVEFMRPDHLDEFSYTTTTPTTLLCSDDVSTIHPGGGGGGGGGGRGGDDNNIFKITHGDIMSTTFPSTSQLLLQPPPQPLNVVEQSLGGAAGAVHVSPSKGGVTFKDLEDLLFDNNNNNNNNALVTEGHDHLIRVDEAGVRNNVVVDTSGADILVICGESVPSWDVGELIPDTSPSLAVNTTDNDLHNLVEFMRQDDTGLETGQPGSTEDDGSW